jgi:prophage regulatory protein
MTLKILRLPKVQEKTGFKKGKIYQLIKSGEIRSIKLGDRAIGFVESEIDEFLKRKIEASKPLENGGSDE